MILCPAATHTSSAAVKQEDSAWREHWPFSPEPIIADEQTACYDASVQGEVLNLFENLLADIGASILITTRNLFLL